jgi:hypothetical protein
MMKKVISFLLACLALVLISCPDVSSGSPAKPSADSPALDSALYSKLEGGWEITEHGNNYRMENNYLVFSEDHVLEYYFADLNHMGWGADMVSLSSDSMSLISFTDWEHSYSYTFLADGTLKLAPNGSNVTYIILTKVTDESLVEARKGFQLVFSQNDNPDIPYIMGTWGYEDEMLLPIPEYCDISSLTPIVKMPSGCTISPNVGGSTIDFSVAKTYRITASDGSYQDFTVTPLHPDKSTNLVIEGDFSRQGRFWRINNSTDNSWLNSCEFSNNEIHATIVDTSPDFWRYQIVNNNSEMFILEYGISYEISFKAKASINRDIMCCIQENGYDNNDDGNSYTDYMNVTSPLTTDYQDFSYTFSIRYPTDRNGIVKFYLAETASDIWIDDVVLKEVSSLPDTVYYEDDGEGFIRYFTCDGSLYGDTWWNYYWETDNTPMSTLEVEYTKKSGSYWPAGVVFNHKDNSNFCHMQIFTDGRYCIVEKYLNHNTYLVGKTYSSLFNTGLNVMNKIRIEWNDTTDAFDFYANDTFLVSVPLSDFPSGRNGGKSGFISAVGTSTVENFPDEPVDFRYRMLQPVVFP